MADNAATTVVDSLATTWCGWPPPPAPAVLRNANVDWSQFDPGAYYDINYREQLDEDCQIMLRLRSFFARWANELTGARGVDVGAGANLYPALAMLPFCRELDLLDLAPGNVRWLGDQVAGFDDRWMRFWNVIDAREPWARVADPRHTLTTVARVSQASVFRLPRRSWDIGTMFFVPCSISEDIAEFRLAVNSFLASLKPGAPFAAACMLESDGYTVGHRRFPSVAVSIDDVRAFFAPRTVEVTFESISARTPFREGFHGMVLVTGRTLG